MADFSATILRRYTPCRPAPLDDVARRLAKTHAELLLIHPFRDGNGRLARWLAQLMAMQARMPIPVYGLIGRGSAAQRVLYLRAVKKGYLGDYDLLAGFFVDALRRGARRTR